MKLTQRLSLRVRLTLIFLILVSITWAISSFVAWRKTTDNVDELFDTQLMLFARRLSTLDLNEINAPQRMAHTPKKLKHGHIDDDALAFAIFSADGKMLLHDGDNGQDIPYRYRREGFDNGYLKDDNDLWRFLWLNSANASASSSICPCFNFFGVCAMRCGALISLRSRVLSRLANNINCVSNSSSTLSVVFLQATKLEIAQVMETRIRKISVSLTRRLRRCVNFMRHPGCSRCRVRCE